MKIKGDILVTCTICKKSTHVPGRDVYLSRTGSGTGKITDIYEGEIYFSCPGCDSMLSAALEVYEGKKKKHHDYKVLSTIGCSVGGIKSAQIFGGDDDDDDDDDDDGE